MAAEFEQLVLTTSFSPYIVASCGLITIYIYSSMYRYIVTIYILQRITYINDNERYSNYLRE